MDVIEGQGEQSVGRDEDAAMIGTQRGSGIDWLMEPGAESLTWAGRSCGWEG
jgi:hypothetical protein